jgi:cystathionine gamma-lyase
MHTDYSALGFGTKAIHAGIEPEPITGAIMTPIFQTSTYVQESPGKNKGYEYSRTHNPTRTVLQDNIAALEGAKHALCFSSGMGATDAICKLLAPGDEVVASSDLYGGTYRIFTKVFAAYGIKFTFADLSDMRNLAQYLSPATKMVWVESPTNPLLNLVDIAAAAELCKARGIWLTVDNTFATPYLQNPLALGAHMVLHSLTKYMAGHSDVVMGAVATSSDELHQRLAFIQNACGAVPGPQDCFLVLRGIKTLHVRMDRHCQNAAQIATWLEAHPKVGRVYYPGLPSHPHHALAQRQMRQPGGMVSFVMKSDDYEVAVKVMEGVKLFSLGESLGGVESLMTHPASMTHASIPREERLKNGLSDSLIRLSCGIEDAADLIKDLETAIG